MSALAIQEAELDPEVLSVKRVIDPKVDCPICTFGDCVQVRIARYRAPVDVVHIDRAALPKGLGRPYTGL